MGRWRPRRGSPVGRRGELEFGGVSAVDVLARLESTPGGLSHAEAGARLAVVRPNALRSHGARPLTVLVRQLRNPISFGLDDAARVAGEQRRGASGAQS